MLLGTEALALAGAVVGSIRQFYASWRGSSRISAKLSEISEQMGVVGA